MSPVYFMNVVSENNVVIGNLHGRSSRTIFPLPGKKLGLYKRIHLAYFQTSIFEMSALR